MAKPGVLIDFEEKTRHWHREANPLMWPLQGLIRLGFELAHRNALRAYRDELTNFKARQTQVILGDIITGQTGGMQFGIGSIHAEYLAKESAKIPGLWDVAVVYHGKVTEILQTGVPTAALYRVFEDFRKVKVPLFETEVTLEPTAERNTHFSSMKGYSAYFELDLARVSDNRYFTTILPTLGVISATERPVLSVVN